VTLSAATTSNSGAIVADSGSSITVTGTTTNTGSGTITADGGSVTLAAITNNSAITADSGGNVTVTGTTANNASGTITADGGNVTLSGATTNKGIITAYGGGNVTLSGNATNTGTIEAGNAALGGDVIFGGNLSNTGALQIYSASEINLDGISNNGTISFENNSGDTGVLALAHSTTFKGTVAGFEYDGSNSDTLDLQDIAFTSSVTSWSFTENKSTTAPGGTLTVTDGKNGPAANILLLGQYLAAGATASSAARSALFQITADDITGTTGISVTTSFHPS